MENKVNEVPEKKTGKSTSALIGLILIVAGGIFLFAQFFHLNAMLIFPLVFLSASLVFLFVAQQGHTWSYIPAYVMIVMAGMFFFISIGVARHLGSYFTFAIALPFLFIYFKDMKKHWWALIPAYVNFAVGFMIFFAVTGMLPGTALAAYIMFAIAAPFFFLFIRNPRQWYWLIPGGVMGLVGAGLLVGRFLYLLAYILPGFMILGGIALLFSRGHQEKPEFEPVSRPDEPTDEEKHLK